MRGGGRRSGAPALEPGAALGKRAVAASAGGLAFSIAGFACRSSNCLPLSPPTPLPRRGRGNSRLFHARGFAPCIPGAEPGRHWLSLRGRCPAGACPVRGGGGVPAPLRLSRERHWLKLALLVPGGGLCPEPPDVPAGHRADRTVSPLIPV